MLHGKKKKGGNKINIELKRRKYWNETNLFHYIFFPTPAEVNFNLNYSLLNLIWL
jgi:hypothetical protein